MDREAPPSSVTGPIGEARARSVSILLPNYNHAAYIGQALAALAAQTRPADEIIVTGSAADDGLGRALASYGLPMYRIGPPPGRRARVNAEIRELAGGRNARSVLALVVGMNVALMAAGIALSLLALLVLWLLGLY